MRIFVPLKSALLPHSPKILMIIALFIGFMTIRLPGIADFMPLFLFMIAFYWSINYQSYLPHWFLFIIGIIQDILYGEMLGVSSLILLLLVGFIKRHHKYFVNKNFIVLWVYFGIFTAVYELFRLGISTFFTPYTYLLETVVMQWILSVAFYPCIHFLSSGLLSIETDHKKRYAKRN